MIVSELILIFIIIVTIFIFFKSLGALVQEAQKGYFEQNEGKMVLYLVLVMFIGIGLIVWFVFFIVENFGAMIVNSIDIWLKKEI